MSAATAAAAAMVALPLADEQQQPAPFLVKTYALVEDPQTDQTISWNSDGDAFVIWDPIAFASNLLPSSFKHNNLSSFIRQLNTYGFRKIVPDRWEFRNELFQRGKKHCLSQIHRRPVRSHPRNSRDCSPSSSSSSSSSDEDRDQARSSPGSHTERSSHSEPERLKKESQSEAERLKKENLSLASELSRLRRLCSDLVLYIQRNVEKPQVMRDAIDLMINPSLPGNGAMDARHVSNSERRDRGSGEEEEEEAETKPGPFLSPHVRVPELAALTRFRLREQSTSSRSSSPPAMLFGVPMQHCRKRMRLSLSCDGEP